MTTKNITISKNQLDNRKDYYKYHSKCVWWLRGIILSQGNKLISIKSKNATLKGDALHDHIEHTYTCFKEQFHNGAKINNGN